MEPSASETGYEEAVSQAVIHPITIGSGLKKGKMELFSEFAIVRGRILSQNRLVVHFFKEKKLYS